jgi:hypothetical protein
MVIARAEALLASETNDINKSCAKMQHAIDAIYKQLGIQREILTRYWTGIESTQSRVKCLIEAAATTGLEIERELDEVARLRDALISAKEKVYFLSLFTGLGIVLTPNDEQRKDENCLYMETRSSLTAVVVLIFIVLNKNPLRGNENVRVHDRTVVYAYVLIYFSSRPVEDSLGQCHFRPLADSCFYFLTKYVLVNVIAHRINRLRPTPECLDNLFLQTMKLEV